MKQRRIKVFCFNNTDGYAAGRAAEDLTECVNGWLEKHPEYEDVEIEFKPQAAGSHHRNKIYLSVAIHYYINDKKTP